MYAHGHTPYVCDCLTHSLSLLRYAIFLQILQNFCDFFTRTVMFVVLSLSGVTHTHGYIRYVCFSLSVVMHLLCAIYFFVNILSVITHTVIFVMFVILSMCDTFL